MKTNSLLLLAALGLAGASAPAQLTIAVQRIGDGTTALSNAAAPSDILTFNGGVLTNTFAMPTAGANRLTESGTATSNGYFNFHNGWFAVGGYNSPTGTASVAGTNTKAVNFLDVNGTITGNTQVASTNWTGNNFRSAISVDGVNFYGSGTGSGTTGGVRLVDANGDGVRLTSTVTNTRNVEIYNNTLLFSTGSGTTGIYSLGSLSGLDTSANDQNTATLIIPKATPYGFFIDFTNGVAFVAGDGGTTTGGISRWDYDSNSTSWVQTWMFRLDADTSAFTASGASGNIVTARGLSGFFDEGTGTYSIFATTSQTTNNQLIGFTDSLVTSVAAGGSFDVIASAGANQVFRGVDVIPEPGTLALLLLGAGLVIRIVRRRNSNV